MIRSSKSTIHHIRLWYILWYKRNENWEYWMNSNEMIAIDLPSLQSIQLGKYALLGSNDESCSLTMRSNNEMFFNWLNLDLPNLTSIVNYEEYSFCRPRSAILESRLTFWISIECRYSKSSRCQATSIILEYSFQISIQYHLIRVCLF